jgi:glycosyltransferase involved in cell wall biosynthesis
MKIAILAPGGFDRSGTERVIPCLLWLVERLVRWGDEVHVFTLRQEATPGQWPLLGASIHNVGGSHPLLRGARALAAVRREHRRASFDVIHALWAVPQGALASVAGKTLRIPVLLHLPGGDLARMPEIRYGGRSTLMGRIALRLAVAGADRIAVPSVYMSNIAAKLGILTERLPFGVALDQWSVAAPRRRLSSAPARLLHVANLSLVKDQTTLLTAAAQVRAQRIPFVLDIIGEDTLRGTIMRRAGELNLGEYVRFHGFLPQRALKEYMYAADVLVVTSRHEAGPVVVLEAAAAGVPSVGTHVGLLADWAPTAARTVGVGDSSALSHTIAALLADEDERLRLAGEAQKKAVAENADATTRAIRDLYLSMMETRRAQGMSR